MVTIPEALATAVRLHNSGRLAEAREIYRQIVAVQRNHADAWRQLAIAAHAQRDLNEAIVAYREAVRLSPNQAQLFSNLGAALRESGRAGEAIGAYREALRIDPRLPAVENNLGTLWEAEGKLDEAAACFERALKLRPEYAQALYNLGNIRKDQQRYDEAIACYEGAIRAKPDMAEAHCNLGIAHQKQEDYARAEECYRAALAIRPMAQVHNNLGTLCRTPETIARSVDCFQQALALDPRHFEALNNLASALNVLGRRAEALDSLDRLLAAQPDYAPGRFNRAMLRLAAGNFMEGWKEFESRWDCPEFSGSRWNQAAWDGGPLACRALLVHVEQGLGDTLQFCRYLPLIPRDGGTVYFLVQEPLAPLLEKSGYRNLVLKDEPLPHFDVQVALLGLPSRFSTTLESIPRQVPYLHADEELVELWRPRVRAMPGLKVGISWQGNPEQKMDVYRSIPLARLAPLAQGNVRLISLQQNFGREQLAGIAGQFSVTDWTGEMDREHGSFMDTAALMKNLDLVITSDTAVAHLAGALAVPVWVPLPTACDWRWLLDRPDCPWYPTMRLFRQTQLGQWDDVFARMAEELRRLAATTS